MEWMEWNLATHGHFLCRRAYTLGSSAREREEKLQLLQKNALRSKLRGKEVCLEWRRPGHGGTSCEYRKRPFDERHMTWIHRGTFNMMFCRSSGPSHVSTTFLTRYRKIRQKRQKNQKSRQDAASKKARNGMKRPAVGSWMPTFGNIPGFLECPRWKHPRVPRSQASKLHNFHQFSIETVNQGCKTRKTLSHHYKVIQSD